MQFGNWDYFQLLIFLLFFADTATAQSRGHKVSRPALIWRQMVPQACATLRDADVYHAGVCLWSNTVTLAVERSKS